MEIPQGCRQADPEKDWLLFDDREPPLAADHASVWPLTDDAAEVYWDSIVGKEIAKLRHASRRALADSIYIPWPRLVRLCQRSPNARCRRFLFAAVASMG